MVATQTIETNKKPSKAKKVSVPQPTTKLKRSSFDFTADQKIKVLGDKIPVRPNSRRADIFALFKNGLSVAEFISSARKLRGGGADIQIALDKGYISLS